MHASELSFGTPTSGRIPGSYNPLTMLFAASRAVVILRSYFYINFLFKKTTLSPLSRAPCWLAAAARCYDERHVSKHLPQNLRATTQQRRTTTTRTGTCFQMRFFLRATRSTFPVGHLPSSVPGLGCCTTDRIRARPDRQASRQALLCCFVVGSFSFPIPLGRLLLCVG